jgi:D-aminopeptidase
VVSTSSTDRSRDHTVAVLLLTNFGVLDRLTVAGHPLGRGLGPASPGPDRPAGSCIGVVVTDAPVDASACARLARRVGLGLARTGSTAHHGSGEIFLAASTSCRMDRNGSVTAPARLSGRALDPLFEAVVDATDEAVLNSMLQSPTMVGRDGNTSPGLDADVVRRHLGLS